jgi:hypothetical protein
VVAFYVQLNMLKMHRTINARPHREPN